VTKLVVGFSLSRKFGFCTVRWVELDWGLIRPGDRQDSQMFASRGPGFVFRLLHSLLVDFALCHVLLDPRSELF